MAQSLMISGLIAKRAEISGLIADAEDKLVQMRVDLAHIDATLRLFDPTVNLSEIKDKQPPHARRSDIFANGEISRRIREAVFRAGAEVVSAEDIVRQTMTDKGLDPADGVLRGDLSKRFLGALHRMHVTGAIRKVGHGLGARWGMPVSQNVHAYREKDIAVQPQVLP